MMRALRSSETSVLTKARRQHIPEDGIFHSHRRENFKSYIFPSFFFFFFFWNCRSHYPVHQRFSVLSPIILQRIPGLVDFVRNSKQLESATFRMFASSNEGRETPTLLGPLERANHNPVMTRVHKPNDSRYCTQSSGPFRCYSTFSLIYSDIFNTIALYNLSIPDGFFPSDFLIKIKRFTLNRHISAGRKDVLHICFKHCIS
jgi:hypothetical protein